MEEKVTKKDVLDRLIAAYLNTAQDGVATVEGSFTSDTLAANAVEFEKAYGEIKLVLEAAFAQTSWGEYLTARAEEHGVMRQAATHAGSPGMHPSSVQRSHFNAMSRPSTETT